MSHRPPMQTPSPHAALDASGRWCEEHRRRECTASRSRGRGICHGSAVNGSDRCRMHLGTKPSEVHAVTEALTAWRAVPGQQIVSPTQAVLGMLQVSWLRAHYLGELLRRQAEADLANGSLGIGSDGVLPDDEAPEGTRGWVGHTYGAVKDIGIFASGEQVRALAQLEERERERCARFGKLAHSMGIEDAQIRLAETQAKALVTGLRQLLVDLGLEKDPDAHAAVDRMLRGVQEALS